MHKINYLSRFVKLKLYENSPFVPLRYKGQKNNIDKKKSYVLEIWSLNII